LHGTNLSENVMLRLVEKGLPRDLAYKIVRDTAIKSYESDLNFEDELLKNEYIRSLLTREELKILLNPKNYLGLAKEIVNHAIQEINSQLN
jgi:Adenylosuccinate lyase